MQPSYAQVTARPPLKRPSLTTTNSKINNKNIHEKLPSSSPSNRFCKKGISTSRKPSQTNEIKNKKYEKEITQLTEEIKALKLTNTEKTAPKKIILQQTKHRFKKRESGLHNFWRPKRDSSTINFIQDTMPNYSGQLNT